MKRNTLIQEYNVNTIRQENKKYENKISESAFSLLYGTQVTGLRYQNRNFLRIRHNYFNVFVRVNTL